MDVIMGYLKILSLHYPEETKNINEEVSSAHLVFSPDNETQTEMDVFRN
jgi:hypothetical protein